LQDNTQYRIQKAQWVIEYCVLSIEVHMREAYTAQLLRAFKQAPWRTQTQAVAAWSVTLLIIAVIGGLYLAVASRAGTAGRDLQRYEAEKAERARANDELHAKLAELRSVTRLANRARELGFAPAQPDQVEYVAVRNYPVAAQAAPAVAPPPTPSSTTASLGDWLTEALHALWPPAGSGGGG
jgi:hypothetical protein